MPKQQVLDGRTMGVFVLLQATSFKITMTREVTSFKIMIGEPSLFFGFVLVLSIPCLFRQGLL